MEIRQVSDIYRSVILSIIAVLLAAIAIRMPHRVTWSDLREGRVQMTDVPVVRVQSGHMDVDANVTNEVDVTVTNPVEIIR
jgi:hypothetical protein